jgi:hypothetical protein
MAVSASDLRAVLPIPSTPAAPTPAQKKVARKEQRVRRELAALVGPRAAPSLAVASRPRLKAKPRLGGGAVKWCGDAFCVGEKDGGSWAQGAARVCEWRAGGWAAAPALGQGRRGSDGGQVFLAVSKFIAHNSI